MWRATDILDGRFTFLHLSKQFAGRVEWVNQEFTYLWDFNLHYFEYLQDLAKLLEQEERKAPAEATIRELLRSWIENNPCPSQPAWHPYPISLRVINWIKFLINHPHFQSAEIHQSLYGQIFFLDKNLEMHLLVNHLLENARALIFGGLYFSGPEAERWLARGLRVLREQLREQLLPQGGHFERSPMYHALLVGGLSDTLLFLERREIEVDWLREALRQMVDWLCRITCPDGSFPLFNDAALGICAGPQAVIDNARRIIGYQPADQPRPLHECDGFYVFSADDFYCAIDGAPIGPLYNPGHAHADNFTYELFFSRRRLIVDSGTYSYDIDEFRRHLRSTRAHNTVVINGLDSSEIWGSFRVARRSDPGVSKAIRRPDCSAFYGQYLNKVRPGEKIVHERLAVLHDAGWFLVWDQIGGKGRLDAVSNLHLGPEWSLAKEEGLTLVNRDAGLSLFCYPDPASRIESTAALYAPEFGKKIAIQKLEFHVEGAQSVEIGYVLTAREMKKNPAWRVLRQGMEFTIEVEDLSFTISFA